jgi:uncharacterized protein YdaL
LAKPKQVLQRKEPEVKTNPNIIKRENTIVAILLNYGLKAYSKIKNEINPQDFKDEKNVIILSKLYEEFEKGNDNINSLLYDFEEELQNHITMIMAYDFEIEDIDKAIDDILVAYKKEKLNERKLEIIAELEKEENSEVKKELERELSNVIISLAKIK